MTIRAGGHAYHVPRGWLVSLDARRPRPGARRGLASRSSSRGASMSRRCSRRRAAPATCSAQLARVGREPVSATVALHGTTVVTTPREVGPTLDRERCSELLATAPPRWTRRSAPCARRRRDPAARECGLDRRGVCSARPIAIDYHGARLGSAHAGAARARAPDPPARAPVRRAGRRRRARACCSAAPRAVDRPRAQRAVRRRRRQRPRRSRRAGRDVDPAQVAVAVTAAAHRRSRRADQARPAQPGPDDRRSAGARDHAASSSRSRRRWAPRRRTASTTST